MVGLIILLAVTSVVAWVISTSNRRFHPTAKGNTISQANSIIGNIKISDVVAIQLSIAFLYHSDQEGQCGAECQPNAPPLWSKESSEVCVNLTDSLRKCYCGPGMYGSDCQEGQINSNLTGICH